MKTFMIDDRQPLYANPLLFKPMTTDDDIAGSFVVELRRRVEVAKRIFERLLDAELVHKQLDSRDYWAIKDWVALNETGSTWDDTGI